MSWLQQPRLAGIMESVCLSPQETEGIPHTVLGIRGVGIVCLKVVLCLIVLSLNRLIVSLCDVKAKCGPGDTYCAVSGTTTEFWSTWPGDLM